MPQKFELCDDFSYIRTHMCFVYIGEVFKMLIHFFGGMYFCYALYRFLMFPRIVSGTSLHNFSEVEHLFPRC